MSYHLAMITTLSYSYIKANFYRRKPKWIVFLFHLAVPIEPAVCKVQEMLCPRTAKNNLRQI